MPQFPVWHVSLFVVMLGLLHSVRPQKAPDQVNTAMHLQFVSFDVQRRFRASPAAQVWLMQSEFFAQGAPAAPPAPAVGPSGIQSWDFPPFAGNCQAEPELGAGLESEVGSKFLK